MRGPALHPAVCGLKRGDGEGVLRGSVGNVAWVRSALRRIGRRMDSRELDARLGSELRRLKLDGKLTAGSGSRAIEDAQGEIDEIQRLKAIDGLAKSLRFIVALRTGGYRKRIVEAVEKLKGLT